MRCPILSNRVGKIPERGIPVHRRHAAGTVNSFSRSCWRLAAVASHLGELSGPYRAAVGCTGRVTCMDALKLPHPVLTPLAYILVGNVAGAWMRRSDQLAVGSWQKKDSKSEKRIFYHPFTRTALITTHGLEIEIHTLSSSHI